MTDLVIVGAGPAGLSAALYAARAGLSVELFDKQLYGGQMATTPEVENYPGIPASSGAQLAYQLYEQATSHGASLRFEGVESLQLSPSISVTTGTGTLECRSLILATGARRRTLGCPGEAEFAGRGVSYCATCDGAFFRNKRAAVVGGGSAALEDALYLAQLCEQVCLILRRDVFRGEQTLVDRVLSEPKIQVFYNTQVKEVRGQMKVAELLLDKAGEEVSLPTDALFVAIGSQPDTDLVRDLLPMDEAGYLLVDESCTTPVPGVFVAGDCRKKPLRQIVTAASDGAVAATAAVAFLKTL